MKIDRTAMQALRHRYEKEKKRSMKALRHRYGELRKYDHRFFHPVRRRQVRTRS